MRFPFLPITVALASCGLTVGVLYHLRSREQGKLWWLREHNDRMLYQAYLRHQASLGAADRPATPAVSAQQAPAQVPAASPAAETQTALQYGYHNAGWASPDASLQSFVWACDRSDAQLLASMIALEPAERKKAENFWATLPAEVRAKWGSVEGLAANLLILSSLGNSFPSSEVLAAAPIEVQGQERAVCGTVQRLAFRKEGGLWKYELSADRLESLYKQISQALAAAPR